MKKRVLSVLLASAMILVSYVSAFAALNEDAVIGKVGSVLDKLNDNATSGAWQLDVDYHAAQLEEIEIAAAEVDTADLSDIVERFLEHEGLTVNQKLYLCVLAKAESDPAIEAILNSQNTSNLKWVDSFDLLQDFSDTLNNNTTIIAPPGAPSDVVAEYQRIIDEDGEEKENIAEYIDEALRALLKISFSYSGSNLQDNYLNGIEMKDTTKKSLMVFASEVVEKEGIPFRTAASVNDLVSGVTDYALSFKNEANIELVREAINRVSSVNYTKTVEEAFDEIAANVENLKKDSTNNYFEGREVTTDIQLLLGDGTSDGVIEELIKTVDPQFKASNMLLNIALSEGIQINNPGGRIPDLQENATPTVVLHHNNSLNIKTEEFAFRGSVIAPISLDMGWFDIDFYKENGDALSGVKFDDGKIIVTKDVSKGNEYPAYMVLYRKTAAGEEKTFIESYPVKIDFTDGKESFNPGITVTTKYTITFNTNGGSEIAPKKYAEGTVVQLTMVPTKDGYIFDGWYSDAELTNKVESITVGADATVYAKWLKDGSAVVSKVEIPERLEGKEHFAYVMGYPEGDIRPNGNITRAEAVTMIFRLLDDGVRTANLTEENVFEDVTADDWFNTAVSTLAKLGIVEGRTETTFAPNASITRAEFATMFARIAEFEYTAKNVYTDIDGHWAKAFIEEVDAYGWIAGYEDDTFRPDNKITRAEAMTLINRVLKRTPENKDDLLDGMTIWTDNNDENAWFYLAVQEATNSHEYERKENGFENWTKLTENKDWTTFEK